MLGTSLGKQILERLSDAQFRTWAGRLITVLGVYYVGYGLVLLAGIAFFLRWRVDIPAGFRELTEATGFTAANGPWFEKVEGNRVWRGFMPGPQHANALGIVHGGMMAAFIDAALGSVVYRAIDRRCVTLRLTLDYLTPARVGDWLEATGELLGHDEHVAQVRGRLYGPRHDVLAGLGDFALLRPGRPRESGARVSSSEIPDNPPEGFKLVDFARGRPEPTFNTHIGNMYAKRGEKGTRDEFVLAIRVQQNMCNPAGGLHGGMMMTVADLVGTMGGGYAARACASSCRPSA